MGCDGVCVVLGGVNRVVVWNSCYFISAVMLFVGDYVPKYYPILVDFTPEHNRPHQFSDLNSVYRWGWRGA